MVHSAPGQLNCRLRLRLTLSLLCTLRAACLGICNLSDENHFLSLSLFLSFSRYSFSVLLSFTPEGRGIGIGGLLPIQQYIQWELVFCCFFLIFILKGTENERSVSMSEWVSAHAPTPSCVPAGLIASRRIKKKERNETQSIITRSDFCW